MGKSRARAGCACSRLGRGLFGQFFAPLSFVFSPPLSGRRLNKDLKCCLKGPLNPKQLINTPLSALVSSLAYAYAFLLNLFMGWASASSCEPALSVNRFCSYKDRIRP